MILKRGLYGNSLQNWGRNEQTADKKADTAQLDVAIKCHILSCYYVAEKKELILVLAVMAERENTMKNIEIREAIEKKRLRYYEVAAALGVHPASFSRWLYQSELTGDKKRRILDAIKRIK